MVGALLLDGAGQLNDLSDETPLAGLQHPAVGFGESGEVQLRELL
jgi:hypothetical protein